MTCITSASNVGIDRARSAVATASPFTAKIAHAGVLISELPSLTTTIVSCGRRCSTTCLNWHRGTLRGTVPL